MQWVRDPTGRFSERPFYEEWELDDICETAVEKFFSGRLGRAFAPPLSDDDLQNLVEEHVGVLDLYADVIAAEGADVEAFTEFRPGEKPTIKVERTLSGDPRRRNRLRTSLSHELGHVLLHRFLYEDQWKQGSLFGGSSAHGRRAICRRETMLRAGKTDWLEWQAGYACGAILMPRSNLLEAVRQAVGQSPFALGERMQPPPQLVIQIARDFQVSEEAARVRLEVLRFAG